VSQFKYLGTTVTNQNFIQEEIKRRLLATILSPRLLLKNEKIRKYKIINLPVVYMGVKLVLILREKYKLGVSENRLLRRIYWPKER
jgi:hypothetical protein